MIRSKKETRWKRNRKFGDVKGGRKWAKRTDNIFKRYHTLERPGKDDELPVYMEDNPSRDFFHPASIADIARQLQNLPVNATQYITHIWLKKVRKADFMARKCWQAAFISGSGVRLIVLNAFPTDLCMSFGKKEPESKTKKFYSQWDNRWIRKNNIWHLQWTKESIKDYYLNHLLLHEIGHLTDWRYFSPANTKQTEDFADSFATIWSNRIKTEIDFEIV